MLNEQAFRATIAALRQEGELRSGFGMQRWLNTCNTAGCIAGTVRILAREGEIKPLTNMTYENLTVGGISREILGLDYFMADHLFTPSDWVAALRYRYFLEDVKETPNNKKPSEEYVEEMRQWAEEYLISVDGLFVEEETKLGIIYRRIEISPDLAALTLEHILERHPNYVDWMAPARELYPELI